MTLVEANRIDRLLKSMADGIAKTDPEAALVVLAIEYRKLWMAEIKKNG